DDVGEADLPPAGAAEVAVDDAAVDLQQLGGHLAVRRGGRELETRLHVRHDARADAADRLAGHLVGALLRLLSWRGRRGGGGGGRRRGGRRGRGPARGRCGGRWRGLRGTRAARRLVVGEELLPAGAHRRRVGEVPLVHLFDEPGVGTEGFRGGVVVHRRRAYRS